MAFSFEQRLPKASLCSVIPFASPLPGSALTGKQHGEARPGGRSGEPPVGRLLSRKPCNTRNGTWSASGDRFLCRLLLPLPPTLSPFSRCLQLLYPSSWLAHQVTLTSTWASRHICMPDIARDALGPTRAFNAHPTRGRPCMHRQT